MPNNVVDGPVYRDASPGLPEFNEQGQQVGWKPLSGVAQGAISRTGSKLGDYDKYGLDAWDPLEPSPWGVYEAPDGFNPDGSITKLIEVRLPGTPSAIAHYTDPRRRVPLAFKRWIHPNAKGIHVLDRFLKGNTKPNQRRESIADFKARIERENMEARVRAEAVEVEAPEVMDERPLEEVMAEAGAAAAGPVEATMEIDPYEELARLKAQMAEMEREKATSVLAATASMPDDDALEAQKEAVRARMAKARAVAAANREARKAAQEAAV